jgi:sugar phosphate permease
MTLGVGAMLGSLVNGYISDKLNLKKVGFYGIIVYLFNCAFCMTALHICQLWIALLASFSIGFIIFYFSNWLSIVCSKVYNG